MTPTRRRRRRSGLPVALSLVTLCGVLAAATWVAHRNDWIQLPGFGEVLASEDLDGPGPGEVIVPLSAVRIPAYTKLTRDHFLRPVDLELARQYLPEERVEEAGLLTNLGELIGRVVAREKAPGYAFRAADLLPEGTRPGLVGGIPAGMRGLRIAAESIQGIAGLAPGDRFDILSAQELASSADSPTTPFSGVYAPQAEAAMVRVGRRARVTVLAQNGVVVEPLSTRQVPVSTASLTRGMTVRTKPVQEMVVALRPEEVAPLMEALAVEAQLTCVPRSGHPDDPTDSVTPELEPRGTGLAWPGQGGLDSGGGSFALVDRIDGDERQLVPVPDGTHAADGGSAEQ